jgi:hypothetical protein
MSCGRTAALAALAFVTAGAAPARAAGPSCGSVVTHSTTLRADLTNCPGDGLVIGADGVTLDLAGHTVGGAGSPDSAGVRLAGHRDVTIENGTLQEFNNGLLLDAATSSVVRGVTVRDSVGRGVQIQNGSDGNRLIAVDSSRTGRSGFGLVDSNGNALLDVSATGNPFSGIFATGSDGNVVQGGVFSANSNGIDFEDGSDDNRVSATLVADNAESGLVMFGGDRNVATANRVRRNGDNMDVMGDDDVVTGNVVTDATGCPDGGCGIGISFEGGTGSLIAANLVDGAAANPADATSGAGIRVDEFASATGRSTIGTVVRGNLVRHAGGDGIAVGTSHDDNSTGLVEDTLVEANVVTGSVRDGIDVGRAANTVSRNVALRNGAFGIEAVAGVIDGGGNIAHGNGDPLQCLRIACR